MTARPGAGMQHIAPPFNDAGIEKRSILAMPQTAEAELTEEVLMLTRKSLPFVASMSMFVAGVAVGSFMDRAQAQTNARVFELRTYTAPEGKLDALNARFRDHTVTIFKKHAMTS